MTGEGEGPAHDLVDDAYFPAEERAEQLPLFRAEAADISARFSDARSRPPPRWAAAGGAVPVDPRAGLV